MRNKANGGLSGDHMEVKRISKNEVMDRCKIETKLHNDVFIYIQKQIKSLKYTILYSM